MYGYCCCSAARILGNVIYRRDLSLSQLASHCDEVERNNIAIHRSSGSSTSLGVQKSGKWNDQLRNVLVYAPRLLRTIESHSLIFYAAALLGELRL